MKPAPVRLLLWVVVWALVALPTAAVLFMGGQATAVVASHESVLRPTLTRQVVVHTGPFLPDVRFDSGRPIGIDITLGKTEAASREELVQRYALIAAQPEGQVAATGSALHGLAVSSLLRGAVVGLVPGLLWLALGPVRRRELAGRVRTRAGAVTAGALAGLVVLAWQPWSAPQVTMDPGGWVALGDYLPAVPLPAEVRALEVSTDATTAESRRLVESAVDTYRRSRTFYADAAEAAATLDLRQPDEDETVAILVSDRHDNIGMDRVARAIADAAGATAVLDAGDDTSTGEPWEAFSLDSLDAAFSDLSRYAVSGNHDHGGFVRSYLADRGWTVFDGSVVEGPGGSLIAGADDPRSSGLGNWREETGLSFEDHAESIADTLCEAAEEDPDQRVGTLLVHDADSGTPALERGCVDLVLSGHLHTRVGPTSVLGANGETGWSYTNGTTGGAAYAIAVGSKIRRPAQVTLVTYREGRPVGLQPVTLDTNGVFDVGSYSLL